MPINKPNARRYVISVLFMVMIVGITFFTIFRQHDFKEVIQETLDVNRLYLLLAVVLFASFVFLEAFAAKVMIGKLGYHQSFWQHIKYVLTGIYFASITPANSGGQPVIAYQMTKKGIPFSQAWIGLVMNAFIYRFILVVFTVGIFIFYSPLKHIDIPFFRILFLAGIVINALVLLVFLMLLFSRKFVYQVIKIMVRFLSKIRILKKDVALYDRYFSFKLSRYHVYSKWLMKQKRTLLYSLIINIFNRIVMFSIGYVIYLSFGFHEASWFDLVAIQAVVSVCVDTLPIPGGVGINEALLLALYQLVYHVDATRTAATLLTRGITFYLPLIVATLIIIMLEISKYIRKKNLKVDRI